MDLFIVLLLILLATSILSIYLLIKIIGDIYLNKGRNNYNLNYKHE